MPAKIGLLPKLAYTAFMAVLIPLYLVNYGPTNFLYFCDAALLLGWFGILTESSLLVSMAAVGIIVVQFLWCIDFVLGMLGLDFGAAGYMFNSNMSLFLRGMSLYHAWLPFVLLWLVHRLNYDKRGLVCWTALGWTLLFVSYFLMPAPPAPLNNPQLPVNINLVFGFSDLAQQTWMSANTWFVCQLIVATLIFIGTHLALKRFMPQAPSEKED